MFSLYLPFGSNLKNDCAVAGDTVIVMMCVSAGKSGSVTLTVNNVSPTSVSSGTDIVSGRLLMDG